MPNRVGMLDRDEGADEQELHRTFFPSAASPGDDPGLRAAQMKVKFIGDFILAAAGLIVLLPVLGGIALLIKLTSKGPVLFRQTRVGKGGKVFEIIKFRTMIDGSDGLRERLLSRNIYPDARLFKLKRDPRVTPLGRVLRRTSFDELPQLFNVLKGEMSLVGPRPPLPCEVELYEDHHMTRFLVRPGITGPWQIAGRNLITDFDTVVSLETEYMAHWGIRQDIQILLKTIPAVVLMRGAH